MEYKNRRASIGIFLQSSATSSLSASHIFLITLFLNILSLCSSLKLGYQFHTQTNKGQAIVLWDLVFMFLRQQKEWQRILDRKVAAVPQVQSALNFFRLAIFLLISVVPRIFELCHIFQVIYNLSLICDFFFVFSPRDMKLYLY